jgi:hypothetical protein
MTKEQADVIISLLRGMQQDIRALTEKVAKIPVVDTTSYVPGMPFREPSYAIPTVQAPRKS